MDLEHYQLLRQDILDAQDKRPVLNKDSDTMTVLLREGEELKTVPNPDGKRSRFRAKFSTNTIGELVPYLELHGASGATGFVGSGSQLSCQFVINMGTLAAPGHADHTATAVLERTPEFAAILAINGKKMTQRDMAEWLEDWAYMLDPRDGNKYPIGYDTAALISLVREFTVAKKGETTAAVGNVAVSRSAMEEVEAKAKRPFPGYVCAALKPYSELTERYFYLRFAILPEAADGPLLCLRIVGLEQAAKQIADEFAQAVREKLPLATVINGSFQAI